MTPKKPRLRVRTVALFSREWHDATRKGWLTQHIDAVHPIRADGYLRPAATMTMPAGPRLSDGIPLQVAP